MINFHASSFTWESHPHQPDPYYKYTGGFVGEDGDVYHVRFNLQSACWIRRADAPADDAGTELFLGSPCRSEYTIAENNLFQIPSNEWRLPFGRDGGYSVASRPSWEVEPATRKPHAEAWVDHRIVLRYFGGCGELTNQQQIVDASLADDLMNSRCTYRDDERGLEVTVEFPVNLINFNVANPQFQVCTGPILLPDLNTWDGSDVTRIFVADVALTRFDSVEFILRREVEAAAHEREWLDQPRGLDRLELIDPNNAPEGYPPGRPKPTVFNEVWDLEATNVIVRTDNGYSTQPPG